MKILIACEYSGIVREAFRAKGHDAWSCDLLPTEIPSKNHIQGDVLDIIREDWDMMIAHPPCTYLTVAAEWAYKDKQTKKIKEGTLIGAARRKARVDAANFFMSLAKADHITKIALENPVGVMSSQWREPDQYIQPYQYGEDASKKTCLWLKNLPLLKPTELFPPRLALNSNGKGYVFRWGNQTDSGQNRLPPSEDRGKLRSLFYQGWADAMAEQWS